MNDSASDGGLDRGRVAALVFAALALTAVLMVLRFPYDRVATSVAQRIEQQTGSRVTFGSFGLSLVRWGPGFAARDVQVVSADGTRLAYERVGMRPALSFAWLAGNPALATEVESASGDASGVMTLGDAPGFSGRVSDLDLEQLPQQKMGAPLQLQGRADLDVDVATGPEGPVGSVEFEARDGMLIHPDLPLPMQFTKLTGEIDLGGEHLAEIKSFELESPFAKGHARGTIGKAAAFASAPLDLQLEFTVSGAVQGSLRAQGVAVGNSGEVRVAVSGTPTQPVVR
jgi:type II secretion system protein N